MPRMNNAALKALASRTCEETVKRGEEVKAKRAMRKKSRAESIFDKLVDGDKDSSGQTVKERLNWKKVRGWFHQELSRNFGDRHEIPLESQWWTGKEISLAKKLLASYSGEIIHEGIIHLCENWELMKENSNGRLTGLPTMGYLWSCRARLLGEVEAGETPKKKKPKFHHRGEYDPERDKGPGLGW